MLSYSAASSAPITGRAFSASTCARALARSAASPRWRATKRSNASATASASAAAATTPLVPSRTISTSPPTGVTRHGVPQASASSATFGSVVLQRRRCRRGRPRQGYRPAPHPRRPRRRPSVRSPSQPGNVDLPNPASATHAPGGSAAASRPSACSRRSASIITAPPLRRSRLSKAPSTSSRVVRPDPEGRPQRRAIGAWGKGPGLDRVRDDADAASAEDGAFRRAVGHPARRREDHRPGTGPGGALLGEGIGHQRPGVAQLRALQARRAVLLAAGRVMTAAGHRPQVVQRPDHRPALVQPAPQHRRRHRPRGPVQMQDVGGGNQKPGDRGRDPDGRWRTAYWWRRFARSAPRPIALGRAARWRAPPRPGPRVVSAAARRRRARLAPPRQRRRPRAARPRVPRDARAGPRDPRRLQPPCRDGRRSLPKSAAPLSLDQRSVMHRTMDAEYA